MHGVGCKYPVCDQYGVGVNTYESVQRCRDHLLCLLNPSKFLLVRNAATYSFDFEHVRSFDDVYLQYHSIRIM